MQIVIDIPDDFYERVNKDGCMSYTDAEVVVNAFYLGKVLPKGHGELIDVKDIDFEWADVQYCDERVKDGRKHAQIHDLIMSLGKLRRIEPIVEADKKIDDDENTEGAEE